MLKKIVLSAARLVLAKAFAIEQNLKAGKYVLPWFESRNDETRIEFNIISKRSIAIFAIHKFSLNSLTEAALNELHRAGYDIVLVSNTPIKPSEKAWLESRVSILIERPNIARDFGAYRSAVLYLNESSRLTDIDSLLFINDTIFFPLFNAEHLWKFLDACPAEVSGAFESFVPAHHIQSFFFRVNRQCIINPAFIQYWLSYKEWNSRRHAIYHGEIGFSSAMTKAGCRLDSFTSSRYFLEILEVNQKLLALHSDYSSKFKRLEQKNPSHAAAALAIYERQLPLLKNDVVKRGTLSFGDVALIHKQNSVALDLDEMLLLLKQKGAASEVRSIVNLLREFAGAA